MTELDEEMRKQGVGWTTELEYWSYVDDITIATTAELAPLVMTKLRETLERHCLEFRKDKCTAYCPTPERVEDIREEMTQILKWTPDGLTILGTASDGEYRTEITTEAHEPASSRLRNARMLADRIKQVCEADLECRRFAPAWKLVTIVLNNALFFDCCVVPPEALASYAQELDEIVEALFPLFVGQDQLESHTKRMRLPRIAGGFDVTPMHLRSPMAFLAQYMAIARSVAGAAGVRAMETLGVVEAAKDAQGRLRLMGLSIDGRWMPRKGDPPNREMDVARVRDKALRNRQASWKQPLAEAATKSEPLSNCAACLHRLGGEENALWLRTNEGPECAPLDDMEFRINARVRLDLPVIMPASTTTEIRWHSRSQVSDPARTACAEAPKWGRPSKTARCGLPHHTYCLLRSRTGRMGTPGTAAHAP